MTVNKLTPNLYTDDVEACVKFWVERMNFEKTVEVPDEGRIAFAALQSGGIEVMYGTCSTVRRTAVAPSDLVGEQEQQDVFEDEPLLFGKREALGHRIEDLAEA